MFKTLVLTLVLLCVTPLWAENTSQKAHVNGTATTMAAQVFAYNQRRNYLLIQNTAVSNNLLVTYSGGPGGTEGVTLTPGQTWEPNLAPVDSIYIRSNTGTVTYDAMEGNN